MIDATIRLVPAVTMPGNRGPQTGMFALQQALLAANVPWLKIGGSAHISANEIPWFWHCGQSSLIMEWSAGTRPFIAGPNVLFINSRTPCAIGYEKALVRAKSCVAHVTESEWYAELIRQWLSPDVAPKVIVSPYPTLEIDAEPLPAIRDALIYYKTGIGPTGLKKLQAAFRISSTIMYGSYDRRELLKMARTSRCCLYLSDDDRGPIAAAEIATCGCPLVGYWRGCPWVPACGEEVPRLSVDAFVKAAMRIIGKSKEENDLRRQQTRAAALRLFSGTAVATNLIEQLDRIRRVA